MKHFMQPRNAILRDNSLDTPSLNPNSMKQNRSNRKQKSCKENVTPSDTNIISDSSPSPSFNGKPSPSVASKLKSALPPRPPMNPLKRKLGNDLQIENGVSGSTDSGVKVIVRMRPLNKHEEGEMIVQKTSGESLSILGQQFTFDSVADSMSSQIDIFQLVGAPLVENCLAGFNSSIFAYGQTGSGKTYTIWGPTNALLEENSHSKEQGLTLRVFERLFFRINEEQNKHADKQLTYQCRCSFLEIYNEQITDLLNPSQKNLHLREDTKTGVYVENLTEEIICNMKDVTQLLKKGLSNRKIGATSVNNESSRSHGVFTCVVESRCKSMDGLSCFKTSRINLVDLAGSERQKSTGAGGERLKEAGNINRSLSQLGNLINILAEVSQTGKQRHIPYRDSKLTFLLQESLGGNAKLAMICAISPSQSCRSETFSTLRFAQRAKSVKNKAVVNEQMQNDVNTLREVIKQLKDELVRMKSTGNQTGPNSAYSTGWNARRSINLLKFSLHHPMILPRVDDDGDEEMEIVEEENKINSSPVAIVDRNIDRKDSADSDVTMEEDISEQIQNLEKNGENQDSLKNASCVITNLPLEPYEKSPILKSPTLTVSPITNSSSRKSLKEFTQTNVSDSSKSKNLEDNGENQESIKDASCVITNLLLEPSEVTTNSSRKSLRTSTMLTASQKEFTKTNVFDPSNNVSFSARSARLAASLHNGLEVINKNKKSCAFSQPSFSFTHKSLDCKPFLVKKDDELDEKAEMFLCRKCKCISPTDATDGLNLQLVPVDDKNKQLVPKAVEKVLAGAIRREMALDELCTKQDYEINQLNRLLQQYKHERECNLIIGQIREDKIVRLESLMDGILSAEEFKDHELNSLKTENKILKENYENHPEVLRTEIEFKRVKDELEHYQNFFDLGEKDILLEEIQDLKTQLQSYINSSFIKPKKQNPILQITYPTDAGPQDSTNNRLESEKNKWKELAEDLERELQSNNLLIQKQKNEIEMEKKCSKELKEAMQMAMEGHAKMLEQYADLEEKHINLLTNQRRIDDGMIDVKKAAAKAGVKGAESRFINAIAVEISSLKMEKDKERHCFKDEINGLQAQLRDTAEAVQAAGELLVRLKEAEEALAAAQARAKEAEQEKEKAYKQIEKLKRKHENVEMTSLPLVDDAPKYEDQQWKDEFDKLPEPSSWFSGYDSCNI